MEKDKIIQRGDTAKYQLTITHANFDQYLDDFFVILHYGMAGETMRVDKNQMVHDEEKHWFMMFKTSELPLGLVKAETHYMVQDSDIDNGVREEVEWDWLGFVTESPCPHFAGQCHCDCDNEDGENNHVKFDRVWRGDANMAFMILRTSEGDATKDNRELQLQVRKSDLGDTEGAPSDYFLRYTGPEIDELLGQVGTNKDAIEQERQARNYADEKLHEGLTLYADEKVQLEQKRAYDAEESLRTSIAGEKKRAEQAEKELKDEIKELRESVSEGTGDAEGVQGTYEPTIDESTQVNNPIGSIESGTPLSELKGKTFSELTDMMLVKETWDDPKYAHTVDMVLPASIVLVGSTVSAPIVTANWNYHVTPVSGVGTIEKTLTVSPELGSGSIAGKAGEYKYTLNYSYVEGYYNIKSNLGNEKKITVPAVANGTISRTMQATYNWFVDGAAQSPLVPINTSYTVTKSLTGRPVIKVPGKNSEISVQADLGFGYMDVDWNRSTEKIGDVDYVVYEKPDSYSAAVSHKITFTIKL